MTRRLAHAPAALAAGIGTAVMAWLGLYGFAWTDYDFEASQAYLALVHGHVARFLQLCPVYGGSLELRAPFALLPGLWGGGELAVFRAVSLPCMAAAAVLAVWLVARLREAGVGLLARSAALGVLVCGPLTLRALEIGHPEELLVGTLCVAAVLAAQARRTWWAAVLLGLAIGAKPWAVLAIGPVLAALGHHRVRSLLVAGAVAVALFAPFTIATPDGTTQRSIAVTTTGAIFQPWQVWWFLGPRSTVHDDQGHVHAYRAGPAWVVDVTHPLIVVVGGALTLLWLKRRRRAGDELLLLALVLHARCLLDPWNSVYYALPCVFALTAWETLTRRRPPALGLLLSVGCWISFETVPRHLTPDPASVIYLAWAVPFAAVLVRALYLPRAQRLATPRIELAPALAGS